MARAWPGYWASGFSARLARRRVSRLRLGEHFANLSGHCLAIVSHDVIPKVQTWALDPYMMPLALIAQLSILGSAGSLNQGIELPQEILGKDTSPLLDGALLVVGRVI